MREREREKEEGKERKKRARARLNVSSELETEKKSSSYRAVDFEEEAVLHLTHRVRVREHLVAWKVGLVESWGFEGERDRKRVHDESGWFSIDRAAPFSRFSFVRSLCSLYFLPLCDLERFECGELASKCAFTRRKRPQSEGATRTRGVETKKEREKQPSAVEKRRSMPLCRRLALSLAFSRFLSLSSRFPLALHGSSRDDDSPERMSL